MLSPDDIAGRDFRVSRRGYDRDEVHAFLAGVAAQVAELEQRLGEAERTAAEPAAAPESEPAPAPVPDGTSRAFAEIGHETQRILEAAREAARGISRKAETDAADEVAQARRRAEEVVAEGERRREAVELVIAQLEQSRAEIAADLRGTQRTIEQTLRDLLPRRPGATMREALSDEARRQTPSRAEPAGPGGERSDRDAGPGSLSAKAASAQDPSAQDPRAGGSHAEGSSAQEPPTGGSHAEEPTGGAPIGASTVADPERSSTPAPSSGAPPEDTSTGPSAANGSAPTDAGSAPSPTGGTDAADRSASTPTSPTSPMSDGADASGSATGGVTAAAPAGGPVRDDDDTDPGPPPLAHAIGPDAPRVRLVTSPSSPPRPYGRPPDPPARASRGPAPASAPATPDALPLRAAALGSLHRRTVRRLKRGLGELETITLDRVRRVAGQGEATALLPLEEDVEAFVGPAADQLEGAYQAGVESASTLAARPLPAPEGGRDLHVALRSDAGRRVGNSLLASLRAGMDSGEDIDALVDRARAVFDDLRGGTADELAGAHLVHAYELGLLDAWAQGGVDARSWVLGEELRCPESRCRHNDRVGPLPVGEPFPSGHDVPPIHVGCTCTTVPATAVPARPEPPA